MSQASPAHAHRVRFVLALAAVAMLVGCHVDADKTNNNEKVNISTPFGDMSVKTNEDAVGQGVGLPVYPGATLIKKEHNDHDDGAADVNMSFGNFHLGVKALSYQTPDDPEKVLAFYRPAMAKFGTVILCNGDHPVGTPDTTQDGLTCSDDDHGHNKIRVMVNTDKEQLKAGSRRHQHIVDVSKRDGYTKIGLIMLDLPGSVVNESSSSQ